MDQKFGRHGDPQGLLASCVDHFWRLWLVGSMGSGKSATMREIQAFTDWVAIDNDLELLRMTGKTAKELASASAAELSRWESAQTRSAAAAVGPAVICAPASVADRDGDIVEVRGSGKVVYLHASPDVAAARVGDGSERPWLGEDPVAWLTERYDARDSSFRAMADLVVETEQRTPREVAWIVLGWVSASSEDMGRAGESSARARD